MKLDKKESATGVGRVPVRQLPVRHLIEITPEDESRLWLIQWLWARGGVGLIGGPPKSCKSWLGLDMALSVASGTDCLDQFPVEDQGPVVIYHAEDSVGAIRRRLDAMCAYRELDLAKIPLYAITTPTLRLDREEDREALRETLSNYKPRLLLLDPLIRLHQMDENRSGDVSAMLGFLRMLQRTYDCAIVLVHHTTKRQHVQPGQGLRGSSDLHAFGDSNAYLAHDRRGLVLTMEHRGGRPPDPFPLELVCHEQTIHLAPCFHETMDSADDLNANILQYLTEAKVPKRRKAIRQTMAVNNQRLGASLISLSNQGLIHHTNKGWSPSPCPA